MSNRYRPNEPECPVPLELLSLLLRSPDERIAGIAQAMPMLQRATLAIYCNGRCHMRRIGLLIAADCTEPALYEVAGDAGVAFFEQARSDRADAYDPAPKWRGVSLARSA